MSLKKYQVFVKTVELGSLTKAARALGSTQSRISHVLRDMEEEYGFALLQRSRSGIRLTQAGQLLLPEMKQMLLQQEHLMQTVEQIRSADRGTVRLGAFTSVAVHWLPGIISAFQAAHPKVELQMFNGDYHDIQQWLDKGEIDLGFVSLPVSGDLPTVPLAQDPLVAILPGDHRLARLDRIPLGELEAEPFISLLQSSAQDIHRALDRAGIRPNIKFTTKDDYAIMAMVEQGLGISIVPRLLLEGSRRNLEIRPLEPEAFRTIALAVPRNAQHLPEAEAFIQSATGWVREHIPRSALLRTSTVPIDKDRAECYTEPEFDTARKCR